MKKIIINDQEYEYKVFRLNNEQIELHFEGESFKFNKSDFNFGFAHDSHTVVDGRDYQIKNYLGRKSEVASSYKELKSPMPGKILKINVVEGQKVVEGQSLMIMEAMKMEHSIVSFSSGVVDKIFFKTGELVDGDVELIKIGQSI